MPDVPPAPGELTALRAANARLREVIEAKDTEIGVLRGLVEAFQAQVEELRAEVDALRARLRQNPRFSELQAISRAGGVSPRSARRRRA